MNLFFLLHSTTTTNMSNVIFKHQSLFESNEHGTELDNEMPPPLPVKKKHSKYYSDFNFNVIHFFPIFHFHPKKKSLLL